MNLELDRILEATQGKLARGDAKTIVRRVNTDTRSLREGDVYVGIRGDRFNGEDFIADAFARGASGVVCTDAAKAPATGGQFVVTVRDTTVALGQIARAWRRTVNPTVVAVTGSSGKTTTKEMAAHLCRESISLLATEGNKNNHIGLPMTLMNLEPENTAAILEIGMNHSGELRALTGICEPTIGVLTNVGDAHLGNFANLDELIAAKGELFAAMKRNTTAVFPADCPNSARMREKGLLPWEVITFGESPSANVRATNIRPMEPYGFQFDLHFFLWKVPVTLPVFGRYQINNALAASTAALLLGIVPETIAERLSTFRAPNMRSHVGSVAGIRVVEDCYNASPSAMVAAIRSFAEMAGVRRRFVLIGDMAELGSFAEAKHREVGIVAAESKIGELVCVGTLSRFAAEEATRRGIKAHVFDTVEAAVEMLSQTLGEGDALLVKGSRLARMERAVELLRAAKGEPAAQGAAH